MKLVPAILALLATTPAHAASFDCVSARSLDERAVCAHRVLNDSDVIVALLYTLERKMMPMGGRDNLIQGQRDWLAARKSCGADVRCLTQVYRTRINELRRFLDERVLTRGPF